MIRTLNEIVRHAAEKYPDKQAFKCGNKVIDYAGLLQKMNQLSHLLQGLGVQNGDRIGIFLPRSIEIPQSVYGILNCGAAYVPLDVQAPPKRLAFLVEDCEISIVITIPTQAKKLYALQEETDRIKTIIGLEDNDLPLQTISWDKVGSVEPDNSSVEIEGSDLAYIIYTSGTTGMPKGIMHTHYSGLSYARLSSALYQLNENDRVGNHSALHFDISTFGMFSAPLACATTLIFPDAYLKMPASLSQLVERENLTVWYSVPSALIQLLEYGALGKRDLSCLRWVLYGGEPFPVNILRKLIKKMSHCTYSNVYGPAEVNQCTYFNFSDIPVSMTEIPLGQIWQETEMLILNSAGEECIEGESGELLIHSSTMMKGYWRQPELTASRILHRTNKEGVLKSFYRTGDLVKTMGNILYFLGRRDRQIKINGYRIELNEIEAIVRKFNEEIDVAAYVTKNDSGEDRIELMVIPSKDNHQFEQEAILGFARKRLPKYSMPDKVIFAASLPRTSAGKVDYRRLQNLAQTDERKSD